MDKVYGILNEAVSRSENENIDFWRFDNDKLIPILIEAIQEHQEFSKFLENALTQQVQIKFYRQVEKYRGDAEYTEKSG